MNLLVIISCEELRLELLKCLSCSPNNGTNECSHHRCFVPASSWVWHFWKDVRQSKCEATSFENWTDIKLPCVTRNIDTHTHSHTELPECVWQQLRDKARFASWLSPKMPSERLFRQMVRVLEKRIRQLKTCVIRIRHRKAAGKHSSTKHEPAIPGSKGLPEFYVSWLKEWKQIETL